MKTNHPVAEISSVLQASRRVLIISHTSPDPDAYGSSCGLALILRNGGKEVVCLNESGASERLSFIPGVTDTRSQIPSEEFDLICVLDCGEIKRVGDSLVEFVRGIHPVLNIDHHISNDLFGDMNYVIPDASSTSELIYDLALSAGLALTPDAATALYFGISGDTGSFRYSNTTAKVFATAEALVRAGARPGEISQALYSRNSKVSVQIQAAALSAMRFSAQDRCVWITVPRALADQFGATREDTEGLVERGRDIQGVVISVFMREEDGVWKVSMRSKDSRYNLSTLAGTFGGGGHAMAAAFRWRGSREDLAAQLEAAIDGLLA